jgi:hypothetical protein
MVLKPLLEEQVLAQEAFKLQGYLESLRLSYNKEGVSMGGAGSCQKLNNKRWFQVYFV